MDGFFFTYDETTKDINPVTGEEVDFRQRTITIKLMEMKGEYLDNRSSQPGAS